MKAADSSQMSLAEACGIQIGDRIVEGKTQESNNKTVPLGPPAQ